MNEFKALLRLSPGGNHDFSPLFDDVASLKTCVGLLVASLPRTLAAVISVDLMGHSTALGDEIALQLHIGILIVLATCSRCLQMHP